MVTPKEEFINALQHRKIIQSVPIWELEFHLWDKFGLGNFTVGSAFTKLSTAEKEHALQENAETMAKVSELLHFSAVTVPGSYWEVSPGVPAFLWLPDDYRIKQTEILRKTIGEKVALVANTGGVMAMPEGDEYVDFSIKMLENPEEVDVRTEKIYENSLKQINRFFDLGVDVFLTASDLADSHSMYFSPDQLERFIFPYLTKWAYYIKQKGGYSILHTDGNVNTALEKIANSGVNALQALDTNAEMDIVATQRRFSDKLCVCGNMDCGLMITANPEVIYEETTKLLQAMSEKGSFILGASNALEYETPAENYLAMIDARNKFHHKNKQYN